MTDKNPLAPALPDTIVDGDRLREVIDKWKNREITLDAQRLFYDVKDLLPDPPTPRTMDEIEWDDEHQGLEAVYKAGTTWESVVRMLHPMERSGRGGIVCVEKDGRIFFPYPSDLTPLPGTKINLTPAVPEGEPSQVEAPDDAEKTHGEVPCLLDKDGDHWVNVGGQWHMVDPDFAYDELPELYGPYRPASKGNDA